MLLQLIYIETILKVLDFPLKVETYNKSTTFEAILSSWLHDSDQKVGTLNDAEHHVRWDIGQCTIAGFWYCKTLKYG